MINADRSMWRRDELTTRDDQLTEVPKEVHLLNLMSDETIVTNYDTNSLASDRPKNTKRTRAIPSTKYL
jgi:hypothetical protein